MKGLSMTGTSSIYVQKGNSPWSIAKKTLKMQGKKVDNSAIIAEMNRLAKVNDCKDVDDFSAKFFSSVGKEIKLEESSRTPVPAKKTSPKPAQKATPAPVKTGNPEIDRINSLQTDTQRIVEYNRNNYSGQYYGIVDKKQCKLFIYDKNGKVVKSLVVGVGKKKGDNLQSYYLERAQKTKDAAKAETGRYTTAGEFTLDEHKKVSEHYVGKDGKPKMMSLKGDNKGVRAGQIAIHMLYKPAYKTREAAIKSPGLADNRMSYGCVNLTEEDYDVMHAYLGEGDKIFILPEEKGNKLLLEKQKDGSYKFAQQYHKNDKRDVSAEQSSKVIYDVRSERAPRKKESSQPSKVQANKAQSNKEEPVWYKPWTW